MYPKMFGVFLQALKNNCYEKRFVIQKKRKNSISLKKNQKALYKPKSSEIDNIKYLPKIHYEKRTKEKRLFPKSV